jgi:hypothetical protein
MAFAGLSDVIGHIGAAGNGHLHAHTSSEVFVAATQRALIRSSAPAR